MFKREKTKTFPNLIMSCTAKNFPKTAKIEHFLSDVCYANENPYNEINILLSVCECKNTRNIRDVYLPRKFWQTFQI